MILCHYKGDNIKQDFKWLLWNSLNEVTTRDMYKKNNKEYFMFCKKKKKSNEIIVVGRNGQRIIYNV